MKTKFNLTKKSVVKKNDDNAVYSALTDLKKSYLDLLPVSQEMIDSGDYDLSSVKDFKFKGEEFNLSHKKGENFARLTFKTPIYNLKYQMSVENVEITDNRTMIEISARGTFLKSMTLSVSSEDLDDENVEIFTNIKGLEFNKSILGRLATRLFNNEEFIEEFTSGDDAVCDRVEAY